MRSFLRFAVLAIALTNLPTPAVAQPVAGDLSLKQEVRRSIERGLDWLRTQQDSKTGAWGDPRYPAITALAVCTILGDPARPDAPGTALPSEARRGLEFILDQQQPDGGIYLDALSTYNSSLCLLALSQAGDPEYDLAMIRLRSFLIGLQADYGERGVTDSPFDGGVGYGGTYTHSDLSNTHFALEALYYSKQTLADTANAPSPDDAGSDLNWEAAIRFVERCQNLPDSNDQPWASDDPDNRGGHIYFPGDSKAGLQVLADGRKIPRSYGSMTYAGLLSFIYAEMETDDPRVVAALDWLANHYTVEENPGMGDEGLFYYYHTMAKALTLCRIDRLELADGSKVHWRLDLAKRLFNLQQADGHWVNDNGRWWEKDPVLVTAYTLLALQHIYHSL